MPPIRKQPLILISSSSDLKNARGKLGLDLRRNLRDMSLQINPYLWEDETEDGRTIQPGTPIQKQINAMLGDRVQMTIVMFGERIGEPLSGEPVDGTEELLAMWKRYGLLHPWPEDPAERWAKLDAGHFPLTGTVYELLVALALNKDSGSDAGPEKKAQLNLKVGYVADRPVEAGVGRDDITLNAGRWFNAAKPANIGAAAHVEWIDQKYNQQKQGILNLLVALGRSPHGSYPHRFSDEEEMVETLTRMAVRDLEKAYPQEVVGGVFKPDLSPFVVDDPMPFPDREELRETLKARLLNEGAAGHILALRGSSGCGKSSLLQKGLLGADPAVVRDAVPVALRPADISARYEPTPLLRFLCALADRLGGAIGVVPELRNPSGGRISDKIDNALNALEKALERNRVNLILGIDQFEEILDLAGLDTEQQRGQPKSWWHILHFIGRAARRPRIWIAVTLETQRLGRLDEMAIEDRTGISLSLVNVNFDASRVSEFVRQTAMLRGLPLAPKLADAIERMVEDHESNRRRAVGGEPTSSFLPLLSLWLHRLFVKFSDRKRRTGDGAADTFGRMADLIDIGDLEDRNIALKLDPLISELVEDAWEEAGELIETEVSVVDAVRFHNFARYLDQSVPGGRQLIRDCTQSGNIDLKRFVRTLQQRGYLDIPGVALSERRPRFPTTVENFFGGLIGVDEEGNMRLTNMPRANDTSAVTKLIEAHLKRRLLEVVGTTNQVRLVHQAVVDNWPPAKAWYNSEKARLITARNIRQAAHAAGDAPDFEALARDEALVANAAVLLGIKRAIWGARQPEHLSDSDRTVRAFCLGLVAAARDGRLEYFLDESAPQFIAVEAARYNLVIPLARWLDADPSLVHHLDSRKETLLDKAGWFAPDVVELLLARGAKVEGDSSEWHPVSGALQSCNMRGIRAFLEKYDGPEAIIGPGGETMLHVAVYSPSSESTRLLLEHVSDIDVRAEDERTPLLSAAQHNRAETVALLLDNGANPLVYDKFQQNVLHKAAMSNGADIIHLISERATDDEREELLFGPVESREDWYSPIYFAAYFSNPEALKALLDWAGDDPIHRSEKLYHPLLAALVAVQAPVPQPRADRISHCVQVLLDHAAIPQAVIESAWHAAADSPDARRLIDDHLVLHTDNLDGFSANTVLTWITSGRPRIAMEALRKRPAIMDHRTEGGQAAAWQILRSAAPETLLVCLQDGIEPTQNAELFRLEAALRVCRANLPEGLLLTDQGGGNANLNRVFPDVDAARLHPIIREGIGKPGGASFRRLLDAGGGGAIRTILHRLALHGDLELYTELVEGMNEPPPVDAYGRLPSASAPPAMRQDFEALEGAHPDYGVH